MKLGIVNLLLSMPFKPRHRLRPQRYLQISHSKLSVTRGIAPILAQIHTRPTHSPLGLFQFSLDTRLSAAGWKQLKPCCRA